MEIDQISRRYPGVLALDAVDLQVRAGEVLAVIGENGAGKSTLMKIMAGVAQPSSGTLRMDGQPVHFESPRQAIHAGVALIHQELNLADNLTVAENIFLGREPRRLGCVVDNRSMRSQSRAHLSRVGLEIDPSTPLAELPLASQQLVEIAKALSADARLVIMDEPTSSLSTREAEKLFEVVEGLRRDDVAVVYISHRLAEVQRLADRVEILRDGRNAGTLRRDQITHSAMVSGMVGRQLDQYFARHSQPPGAVRLRVEDLVVDGPFRGAPATLEVRAGEVVGLAGLVGSGRSELLETIFGVRESIAGSVWIDGKPMPLGDVSVAISRGVALVPEDRKGFGLVLDMSVRENMTLAALSAAPSAPRIDSGWERRATDDLIERLNVKAADQTTSIDTLSGGNQQKVALGKWLLRDPHVLLLDEPTRGVDIGAKHEIYGIIGTLAAAGVAVLFVSSEMEEVLGLADRTLVMHEGRIAGHLTREQMSEEAIMRLAVGDVAGSGTLESPASHASTAARDFRAHDSSEVQDSSAKEAHR